MDLFVKDEHWGQKVHHFVGSTEQAWSLFWWKMSHHPSRLLITNTTLRNSLHKEWSGPCILGILGKTSRSARNPWKIVSPNSSFNVNQNKLLVSHVWLFTIPWTVAHQAPLFMKFTRQEYWSRLPFSSSGDLPEPGIRPRSPALQVDSFFPWVTRKAPE